MFKTMALIGLTAALALPAAPAFAVTAIHPLMAPRAMAHSSDPIVDAFPAIVEPRQRKQGACAAGAVWIAATAPTALAI